MIAIQNFRVVPKITSKFNGKVLTPACQIQSMTLDRSTARVINTLHLQATALRAVTEVTSRRTRTSQFHPHHMFAQTSWTYGPKHGTWKNVVCLWLVWLQT